MLLLSQKKDTMKSKFISFEGIDGSGKTTQIKLLNDRLLSIGQKSVVFREPGDTSVSDKIRKILLDRRNSKLFDNTESLLFFSSRHQLLFEKIIPALNKGLFVLCDRFNDSTIAYQGYGKDEDISELELVSDFATKGIKPDITFYLDIDVNLSIKRRELMKDDRIEQKGAQYLNKVRQGFLTLSTRYSDRIYVINGDCSKDQVFKEIRNILNEKYQFSI